MKKTVLQTLNKFFWYCMANSTIEDVGNSILNDESFLRDVKNSREATIHLSKKHLGIVTSKVVNDMLNEHHYTVTLMKYRFKGMDVFVSQ